jgi:diguanylate cyclase (GGDEF)-like protein
MENKTNYRTHDLKQEIQALERRDYRATVIALLALSIVVVFFAGLLWLGSHIDTGYATLSICGVLAVVVMMNVLVSRRRLAFRKSQLELMGELEKLDAAEKFSLLDPMTETYNLRYLERILPAEKNRADRTESALSFVMTALEEFDKVNAKFGARTGERIVRELAQMLKMVFRPTDTIVRYDANLFLIVMPNSSQNGAMVAVKRFMQQVEAWNHAGVIPGYQMRLDFGYEGYNQKSDIWNTIALAKQRLSIFRERSLAASAGKA